MRHIAPFKTPEEEVVVVVVFTRENRGGSAQHATRATPTRSSHGPMEEEAVFIRGVNTNEDPPNAHQAQHRPVQATGAMSA